MSDLVTIHDGNVDLLTAVLGAVTRIAPEVVLSFHEGFAVISTPAVAEPEPEPVEDEAAKARVVAPNALRVVEEKAQQEHLTKHKFDPQTARAAAAEAL